MEKYPYPLSLKYESSRRCNTAVLPQIRSARISVSRGLMQEPLIFDLNSTDDNGGMKKIQLKWNPVEKSKWISI